MILKLGPEINKHFENLFKISPNSQKNAINLTIEVTKTMSNEKRNN